MGKLGNFCFVSKMNIEIVEVKHQAFPNCLIGTSQAESYERVRKFFDEVEEN